jgi:hypothetical protein
MKKKVEKKSKAVDMVYEGISKQEDALKQLSAKRLAGKGKARGSKFKGGLYASRYEK